MRITIAPGILDAFPGLRVAVLLARGLDNHTPRPTLSDEWNEVWKDARRFETYGNAQSHPRVGPWRERFRELGYSGKKFPSSVEALLRRALRGGEPFSINPLVDFYNTVSLAHVIPAGGFDVDGVSAIELRFTRRGDVFQPLDGAEVTEVEPGEVSYVVGNTILTRHFVWRQSKDALIQDRTSDALILAEVLGDLPPEVTGQVARSLETGIERHFGVQAPALILSAEHPDHSW